MPKVILTKEARKVDDFSGWIVGKMYKEKKSQKELAQVLGVTQPAISHRLEKGEFKHSEMMKIFHFFNATDEEILRFTKL